MAKITKKNKKRNSPKSKNKFRFFTKINLSESYASLILGAIVVLIVGVLFMSFAKGNRSMQTSSVKFVPKVEDIQTQDSSTSSTYTIRPGDDLWTISENVYNNGYKWVEIAKINNLQNPGLIYSGENLIIPTIVQDEQTAVNTEIPQGTSDSSVENISITGNTYMIKSGDNLWDIAIRAYGDGFKWPEIAKVNNLENPDLIFAGNVLKLPR
jgi:putative chitinase